jgi:RIO kinase 1
MDEKKFKGKPWNPDRDKYFSGVFGRRTLMTLYKLSNKGYIQKLGGEISRGKEAAVFVSYTNDNKHLAIKIFRRHPSFEMMKYIKGDPRFKGLSKKKLIETWSKKEFRNLKKLTRLGVRVPKPISVLNNVLVMEFIGEGIKAAKTYKDHPPEDPVKAFKKIKKYLKLSYEGGIVHGDLSEYNILNYKNNPVIIDCGQGVVKKHPNFMEFFKRDIKNIVKYFSKLGVKCKNSEVEEYVLSSNT